MGFASSIAPARAGRNRGGPHPATVSHTAAMSPRRAVPPIAARATVRYLLLGAPLVVLCAGAGFAALERQVGSYWEGLWWALSLMTTVGFVGEAPETAAGQVVSAILMVSGFALLTVATAAIASLFVREEEAPAEQRERDFERVALDRLDELAARLGALERALAGGDADPPARST